MRLSSFTSKGSPCNQLLIIPRFVVVELQLFLRADRWNDRLVWDVPSSRECLLVPRRKARGKIVRGVCLGEGEAAWRTSDSKARAALSLSAGGPVITGFLVKIVSESLIVLASWYPVLLTFVVLPNIQGALAFS